MVCALVCEAVHECIHECTNIYQTRQIRGFVAQFEDGLCPSPRQSDGALDPGFRCAYMLGLTMNRQAATASLLKQAISESAYEF